MNLKIFKAKKKHSKDIIRLINKLAEFEKLEPPDKAAKRRLIKDAFPAKGKKPSFHILGVSYENEIVAYAFYFFTYSSFLARKTLYLEDIFISSDYRNKGIGKMLMKELEKIARKNGCGRMEWCVLDWNTNAINFYEKLGAKHLKEWKNYRISL